jgi:high-affinity iron transporter
MQIFLIVSTCFLYLVAAGLMSRGVWYLENNAWNHIVGGDSSETGSGPGSYNIEMSIWHVNCCNPELAGGGGWGIFNALLGWTNSATYGSVISYNLYWLAVMIGYALMLYRERRGPLPYIDPAMRKVANTKGRAKAFVFRQKYEPDPDPASDQASGAIEHSVSSKEQETGAGVSTAVKPTS